MKKVFPVCFFAIVTLINSLTANAQPGWQWAKSNSPSFTGVVEAYPTAADTSGNAFIAGLYFACDSITIGPTTIRGAYSAFVSKTDASGNFLWTISTMFADCQPSAICTDPAGNLYLLGLYLDDSMHIGSVSLLNPSGSGMSFIAKIDPAGTVLWAHNIVGNHLSSSSLGGIDASGDYVYVTGAYNLPTATVGPSTLVNASPTGDSMDIYVAKYNHGGGVVWAKSFGGHGNDRPHGLSVSPSGEVYLTGEFNSAAMILGTDTLTDSLYGTPSPGSFIAKLDMDGNPVWAKSMNASVVLMDIRAGKFNNAFVGGKFTGPIILGTDTLGFTGTTGQAIVMDYDSSGTLLWARAATGDVLAWGYKVAADTCGNVWMTGSVTGNLHCDLTTTVTPPASHYDPVFIAAWDHCGTYIAGTGNILGSGGDDQAGIALDNRGNLFIGGDYENADVIAGTDTLHNPGTFKEFVMIAKYRIGPMPCSSVPCHPAPLTSYNHALQENSIRLFPNPANTEFNIESDVTFNVGSRLNVYDISGRLIYTAPLAANRTNFPVSSFAPGVYQCRIICNDGQVVVKKLVVIK